MPELRQPREVLQAVVGERLGSAEIERRDVIELRHAREQRVGHLAVRLQAGELALVHDVEQLVPVTRVNDGVFGGRLLAGSRVRGYRPLGKRGGRGRQCRRERLERLPRLEPLRARHEVLRIRDADDVVFGSLRLFPPAEIEADVAPHGVPRSAVAEIVPDDLHRCLVFGAVRRHERFGDALIPANRGVPLDEGDQAGPAGHAELARDRLLDVAQRGRGRWLGQRALQPRPRRRITVAKRLEPAFGFFPEIVEGRAGRDGSRHDTFLP